MMMMMMIIFNTVLNLIQRDRCKGIRLYFYLLYSFVIGSGPQYLTCILKIMFLPDNSVLLLSNSNHFSQNRVIWPRLFCIIIIKGWSKLFQTAPETERQPDMG